MIAVGESGGAVVLVFETKSAKQTLSDDEAVALHAQLGLLLQTRAKRTTGTLQFIPGDVAIKFVDDHKPDPPRRTAPIPHVKRKPMIVARPQADAPTQARGSLDGPRGDVNALLGIEDEDDVDPIQAAADRDAAELAARGEAPGKNTPDRPSPEAQQKRRAAGLAKMNGEA